MATSAGGSVPSSPSNSTLVADHVTDATRRAICDYACALMRTLRMAQWTIAISGEPSDDDCYASITSIPTRHYATIRVCSEWYELDEDTQRNSITHEVLHLLHKRVDAVVLEDTEDLMHDYEHRQLERAYRRETELMVDHLAGFMGDTHQLAEAWRHAHQETAQDAKGEPWPETPKSSASTGPSAQAAPRSAGAHPGTSPAACAT